MSAAVWPASATARVVQFFKALADETRVAILRLLALSDLRAGEIVEQLHLPQNAVSYHLKQLRAVGLLRDRRSSSDARDVYYSIDHERLQSLYLAAGETLNARLSRPSEQPAQECLASDRDKLLRILFLCTHNSARSQLAEGITRHLGGDQVEVFSAGSQPTDVHPLTIRLLQEWGIDPSEHTSKSLDQFVGQSFDYIITVCDRARDSCPTFPGDPKQIHWSLPDPTVVVGEEEQWRAFCTVRRELNTRIRYLLCLPHPGTGQRLTMRTLHQAEQGAS